MAEKSGSKGTSGKGIPTPSSLKIKADSRPVGEGSPRVWINDRGETCIGNECFSIAVKQGDEDITVRIDRNKCGEDLLPIVESISEALGKGGRTLWETTSLSKKKGE